MKSSPHPLRQLRRVAMLVAVTTTLAAGTAALPAAAQSGGALSAAAVDEILNTSLNQKKGLSIYMAGQVINCVFVKRIDGNTIEVRNQQFSRIILRVDRIDAIALS